VIVLENAVTISPDQFLLFLSVVKSGQSKRFLEETEIPGSYTEVETLNYLIPPMQELGARNVYYNSKNLQFKLDDGVHMISSFRKSLKRDRMEKA